MERAPSSVHIETYGCQMNQLDSELVAGILGEAGYELTQHEAEADVILINTCAVRAHAEQRVLGRLGSLRRLQAEREDVLVGVVGCMAQRLGLKLMEQCPQVRLVAGPDAYRHLPELIAQAQRTGKAHWLKLDPAEQYEGLKPHRQNGLKAWVSVMRGCDNQCAYCVVPHVRGRERSRPLRSIVAEVQGLSQQGYREVTLLGQNVNSYRDGQTTFADLLRSIDRETDMDRVRFMTSHPKDLWEDVLESMADCPSVCEHLHLPLQSGSSRVLKAMNRGYTAEGYLALVDKSRRLVQGLSLTTDVMAGFPGETKEDFEATLALMKAAEFDDAFTYQYSPRPGTKAFELAETVSPEEKHERLSQLIATQRSISERKNAELVGTELEVLVEARAKRGVHQVLARTRTDRPVIVEDGAGRVKIGDMVCVEITASTSATLAGDLRGLGRARRSLRAEHETG